MYLSYASPTEEPGVSLSRRFDWLVAAENHPQAQSVYEYRPPLEGKGALLVGNEAKGLRRRTRKQAHALVEIPLPSKNINCLNVAAAAAILLYYLSLSEPLPFKKQTLSSIQKHRPDILLVGGRDPRELGSAIRSACAFGWAQVFLQDRGNAWYECDRVIRSEGRGTARRGRNPIRVTPYREEALEDYRRILVCTQEPGGKPPYTLPLIGRDTLIVLPDAQEPSASWFPESTHRAEIIPVTLPSVPAKGYHYRQMASIALAEIARQLGRPDSEGIYLHGRRERYRREVEAEQSGDSLAFEDLLLF